ncbi:hypothetical protein B0H17DRAFT_1059790 [Mycena rosella]|uniref:F-box domain-containing protein n=1 Tax=Mycena rosella TaxID=1033263 RepID=A0AAD7DKF2_MYCRO|nr:hypothetical protein B0H17DRAFT_1059790 [Mycena rosella]
MSVCSECGGLSSPLAEEHDSKINVGVTLGTLARHLELMNTNAPPEGPELSFIRSVVSKTESRLAYLDGQIFRHRDRLRELEEERAALWRYHTPNKAILSPLRRMPPEVLAEIFLWTLPTLQTAFDRSAFGVKRSPWLLTQISSRWRAVAVSTPALWSHVIVACDHEHANPLSIVKSQIERAQKLKIHFYGSEKRHAQPQIEIFRFLAEHSSRWEELSIGLTSHLFPLLGTLKHRLPALRRLWVEWDGPESQAGVEFIDCFQPAPSLLDVAICNDYRSISIPLPAHQLTRYNLDAPWKVHAGILKRAHNLVQARIDVKFDADEPWPDHSNADDSLRLRRLRRLYLSHPGILNYLTTPALQAIYVGIEDDEEPIDFLEPFLIRSLCNLTRLCLAGFPNSHQLTGILRKVPSIVELEILVTRLDHTIPDIIGNTTVAPQLLHIYFGWVPDTYVDCMPYLEMLRSRWNAENCALKTAGLLVNSESRPAPAALRSLDALRQDGLDILLLQGTRASDALHAWAYGSSWN